MYSPACEISGAEEDGESSRTCSSSQIGAMANVTREDTAPMISLTPSWSISSRVTCLPRLGIVASSL